jgi:hypothetical protein
LHLSPLRMATKWRWARNRNECVETIAIYFKRFVST